MLVTRVAIRLTVYSAPTKRGRIAGLSARHICPAVECADSWSVDDYRGDGLIDRVGGRANPSFGHFECLQHHVSRAWMGSVTSSVLRVLPFHIE